MDILLKYFPELSPAQVDQYRHLEEIFREWNSKINLVSRKDAGELVLRHILHSLSIGLFTEPARGEHILDVGTGGGFPGIPLAILFPEAQFSLIDSIGKKILAVNDMIGQLNLKNVKCIRTRAEDFHEQADYIVSRAVTRLDPFIKWTGKNLSRRALPNGGTQNRKYGIWYLKGGNLEEELKPFMRYEVFDLKQVFTESFFETKKLVWIPISAIL